MKRSEAILVYNTLLGINMNKMPDDMIDAILVDTLALSEIAYAADKAREELHRRVFDAIPKERREAYDDILRKAEAHEGQKRAAVLAMLKDNYPDIDSARRRFNRAVEAYLDKKVSVEIEQIDRSEFVKACRDSNQPVTPLMMERIAPIFNGYNERTAEVDSEELRALLND